MIMAGIVLASALAAICAGILVLFTKRADRLLLFMAVLSFALCVLVLSFGSKKLGLVLSLIFLSTDVALYFFARASQLSSSAKISDKKKYFVSRTMILSYSLLLAFFLVWGIWTLPLDLNHFSFGSEVSGEIVFFNTQIWSFWFSLVVLPAVTILGVGVSGFLLIRRRGQAQ